MATATATGTSIHAIREARRRGTDRIGLITGKIQSLPPDLDQSRKHSAQHEDVASGPALPSNESSREPSEDQVREEMGAPLPVNRDKGKSILSTETGESLPLNHDEGRSISSWDKGDRLTTSSDKINPMAGRKDCLITRDHQRAKGLNNSHETGQFRSAIAATENLRMSFSAVAAILVMLSHAGFPILGSPSIKSTILLGPLYLLVLKNISILLAWVISTGQPSRSLVVSRSDPLARAMDTCLVLQMISTVQLIGRNLCSLPCFWPFPHTKTWLVKRKELCNRCVPYPQHLIYSFQSCIEFILHFVNI